MEQNQNQQPPMFNQPTGQIQPNPQYQPQVQGRPMMEPMESIKTCFKKFFDFTGRARRSEYWWFFLFCIIVSSVFSFVGGILPVLSYVGFCISALLLIPSCSVQTRRLHDTGRSGWWVVVQMALLLTFYGSMGYMFMPYAEQMMNITDNMEMANVFMDIMEQNTAAVAVFFISALLLVIVTIILIVFSVLDSHWTENKYGPSPKYQ